MFPEKSFRSRRYNYNNKVLFTRALHVPIRTSIKAKKRKKPQRAQLKEYFDKHDPLLPGIVQKKHFLFFLLFAAIRQNQALFLPMAVVALAHEPL